MQADVVAAGAADDVDAGRVGADLGDQPGERVEAPGQLLGLDGIGDAERDDVVEHPDIMAAAFYGSGVDPATLVDLDAHPFADGDLVARCRAEPVADGVTCCPASCGPTRSRLMVAEVDAPGRRGPPPGRPGHAVPGPARRCLPRWPPAPGPRPLGPLGPRLRPVPGRQSPLRALYEWDGLMAFLGGCWRAARSTATPTRSAR